MKKNIFLIILLIISLCGRLTSFGQTEDKVRISAARSKGISGYRVFYSSPQKRVILKQKTTTIYCDEARQNIKTEDVTATGNVIVIDKKTKITGSKLLYKKNQGEVIITGRIVKLIDEDITLVTDKLYYYTSTKEAKYLTGGTVNQETMVLTSVEGYLKNKELIFIKDVVMDDSVKTQHLVTEKLIYDRETKISTFNTRTVINSKDGDVTANAGTYNTDNGKVHFEGSAIVENDKYILVGDKIDTNKNTGNSKAVGNVIFFSKEDTAIIYADVVVRFDSSTFAYGNALMSKPIKGNWMDMYYLAADTLHSINDTTTQENTLYAYHNVAMWSKDMKSRCDSLVYYYNDSMIYFYQDPRIWAQKSQMTGEVIRTDITSKGVERLYLNRNGFIISEDTIQNYNQVKGKKIIAHFENNSLFKVDVKGNGMTRFFQLTDDKRNIYALNKSSCPAMTLFFEENNEVKNIEYNKKHDSNILPPSKIQKPDMFLPGFKNRFDEIPPKDELLERVRLREDLPDDMPRDPTKQADQIKILFDGKQILNKNYQGQPLWMHRPQKKVEAGN
ncbi:hypothetical protein EI427_08085 [Flammeovirga pectinis]|uniref:Organic solvent tolerance-like N-terminal domain-containing protein n=1 Tax=Flammeovirga pectinis TaxID=2494373 RepID=A0A3Q9FL55_9BACT|nr:OstA-like protein [Flammeovirga pectinis]AZQ62196.1 hypothetical protein EI427_08085 [Flammeovirga pectinis]